MFVESLFAEPLCFALNYFSMYDLRQDLALFYLSYVTASEWDHGS